MNKDNAKDYLPLVQALAEGKVIQIMGSGGWNELPNYDFTSPVEHYRIKPEQREIWVNHYSQHNRGLGVYAYGSRQEASKAASMSCYESNQVRYREVIE